jgi:hypothetical protein
MTRVHYRIHVYQNARPPLGKPRECSLCPQHRWQGEPLSGDLSQVNCEQCLTYITEIGLDQAWGTATP